MYGVHAQLGRDYGKEDGSKNQYCRGHIHKYTHKEQNEIDQQEDDHRIVAEGLRRILEPEFELVGEELRVRIWARQVEWKVNI